ncbi:MAG: BrnT family toxin [Usitatibacter sp.]
MDFTRFEWDPAKELENFAKHGVFFSEAQLAFLDERCVVTHDLDHSDLEARYFCFGRVSRGILTVRFTRRSGVIRIIGAGFWRKGKAIYERENSLHR